MWPSHRTISPTTKHGSDVCCVYASCVRMGHSFARLELIFHTRRDTSSYGFPATRTHICTALVHPISTQESGLALEPTHTHLLASNKLQIARILCTSSKHYTYPWYIIYEQNIKNTCIKQQQAHPHTIKHKCTNRVKATNPTRYTLHCSCMMVRVAFS